VWGLAWGTERMDGSSVSLAVRHLRGKLSGMETEISQRENNLEDIQVRVNELEIADSSAQVSGTAAGKGS
jgi:cell division protein FtsL